MVLYYIVITRISFMDYQSLLNEHQYAAVTTDSQYVRVVAGAGSGKTRVLTYRLAYLVGEKNVEPSSIVAIAFTNKVANEMKVRALSLLGRNYAGLQVSTFHSFCAKFLRREIDVLGFPVNFTIFDDDDRRSSRTLRWKMALRKMTILPSSQLDILASINVKVITQKM